MYIDRETAYLERLIDLASRVKGVVMDVDGVLVPDAEYLLPDGGIIKSRSHNDGQGISLMRAIGLEIAFITGESANSPGGEIIKCLVDKWNNLPSSRRPGNEAGWPLISLYTGLDDRDKGALFSEWLGEVNLMPENCAVMGDDLVDVPMLAMAGFKVVPAQAEKVVKEMADWITPRDGGYGAVRDLANLLVDVRSIDPLSLPVK